MGTQAEARLTPGLTDQGFKELGFILCTTGSYGRFQALQRQDPVCIQEDEFCRRVGVGLEGSQSGSGEASEEAVALSGRNDGGRHQAVAEKIENGGSVC